MLQPISELQLQPGSSQALHSSTGDEASWAAKSTMAAPAYISHVDLLAAMSSVARSNASSDGDVIGHCTLPNGLHPDGDAMTLTAAGGGRCEAADASSESRQLTSEERAALAVLDEQPSSPHPRSIAALQLSSVGLSKAPSVLEVSKTTQDTAFKPLRGFTENPIIAGHHPVVLDN